MKNFIIFSIIIYAAEYISNNELKLSATMVLYSIVYIMSSLCTQNCKDFNSFVDNFYSNLITNEIVLNTFYK